MLVLQLAINQNNHRNNEDKIHLKASKRDRIITHVRIHHHFSYFIKQAHRNFYHFERPIYKEYIFLVKEVV